jgi:hypothetical protein
VTIIVITPRATKKIEVKKMPRRSIEEVRKKAAELQEPLTEFFRRALTSGYGDEVDQLRVVGYLCQLMMEMVERELSAIKLQEEMEGKRRIVVANN